ncbi:MAG: HD domain-containing protein [Candidatus Pacebacteria bacterium]|nr:HD domain-containing protein [Candidatus Paceibacterota bacterium]
MKNPESLNFSREIQPETPNESSVELTENTAEAKKIASRGEFSIIKAELKEKGLLAQEMIRVKSKYQEALTKIEFLTDKDLEMFTIIDLYDEDLAAHSLETYRIAKEKVERELAFEVILVDLFAKEGVTSEQFFRACLLHDIGKIEIPNFILNNSINNNEMDFYLRGLVLEKKDQEIIDRLEIRTGEKVDVDNEVELKEFLRKYRLRSVHFVPIKFILSETEQEIMEARGFDLNSSLMDIIKTHEGYSEIILKAEDLPVESALAGSHHNYHGGGSPYPLTIDALHLSVDMVELIRIADMTEALTASRTYNKAGFSKPKVLKIILDEARVGRINTEMAYLWIEDEIKQLEENSNNLTTEDLQDIIFVKEELAIIHSNMLANPASNPFALHAA